MNVDKYVLRGGSWCEGSWYAHAAARFGLYDPVFRNGNFGFRVLGVLTNGDKYVLRGGSWCEGSWYVRAAARFDYDYPDCRFDDFGFRVFSEGKRL